MTSHSDMQNLIYKGAINSLGFGNVSYNILRELYRKSISVAFFPFGDNLVFDAFDKIDSDFHKWVVAASQNRFHLMDKDYHTLCQWHLNGSESRVSRRQTLLTFYETDEPTDGDLERFLTARWGLIAKSKRNKFLWGQVHHPPWQLHSARLLHLDDSLVTAAGLPEPEGTPHVMYSEGVPVRIGWPKKI